MDKFMVYGDELREMRDVYIIKLILWIVLKI
ncbi:MAG: hypothetical protein UX70_C0001G0552 [Candidatus Wolfebacteria bacterium GW2011_GWB1_47_1]|uniref:Uncharacterized protein n=1 Tax=Candidatus Wolfebacteria bacterium GW2011_GWB1_47_1 TaxID=1619007 RepID=A0A0G4ASY4_9BACT|nr:MAG: hypothetical protein UX70_C0001G0552 [Candidatus Wolfebacteria bacterium GW2011_GWB1_47_1]